MTVVTTDKPLVFWTKVEMRKGGVVPDYPACAGEEIELPKGTRCDVIVDSGDTGVLVKAQGKDAYRHCSWMQITEVES